MTNVWRLHLRSAVNNGASTEELVKYCIDEGIAGIGWAVELHEGETKLTKDEYCTRARKKYGKAPASVGFACYPNVGDLIWARLGANYYLGKITSDWEYREFDEDKKTNFLFLDIPNQRKCEWIDIGSQDNVPGKIIAAFRQRRAFQRVDCKIALATSLYLYYNKDVSYLMPWAGKLESLYDLLNDQDCEDIVGLYLQKNFGYYILAGSCKIDTIDIEYILKHQCDGHKAYVQVKQGSADPSLKVVPADVSKVFYFTTKGDVSDKSEKAHIIAPQTILDFCFHKDSRKILPEHILKWIDILHC